MAQVAGDEAPFLTTVGEASAALGAVEDPFGVAVQAEARGVVEAEGVEVGVGFSAVILG